MRELRGIACFKIHEGELDEFGRPSARAPCLDRPLREDRGLEDHKAPVIASLASALPPPHRFLPRRELAGEIEWGRTG